MNDPHSPICNRHLCILPWIHLFIKQNSQVYPCCFGSEVESFGDVKERDFLALANDEPMKTLRRNMLAGKPSPHCTRCYEAEAAGFTSLRQHKNKEFEAYLPKTRATKPDGTVDDFSMKYLDIRFSNICNFKCRFCGHASSSLWYDEYKMLFPGFDRPRVLKAGRSDDDLWRQIEPTLDHVESIYFAGGEPLIMKEHYMILERLIALGRTNVRLSYNTNMSVLRYKDKNIVDLWQHFENVQLGISVDGVGKRAEYIRKGTVWPTFLENIQTVRSACPHVTMRGNLTITVFNVMTFAATFSFLDSSNLFDDPPIDINFLNDPKFYSIQILPEEMKIEASKTIERLATKLDGMQRSEEASATRAILTFMHAEDKTENIPNFFRFTDKLDAFRKESFDETFPELKPLRDWVVRSGQSIDEPFTVYREKGA
jgi:sulfatase maturation enzyme AslB (radical SAM superfamily)